MSEFLEKVGVGEFGLNNLGQCYEIIHQDDKDKRKVRLKFVETGYELDTWSGNLYKGRVKDRYTATVHGVGILGEVRPYSDPHYHKIYTHWAHMIRRCHDPSYKQYKNYGGDGVTVVDRWLRFDNFYDDFRHLDGYSEEIMGLKLHRHLDKDIKQDRLPHNQRVYSLETCCLITKDENEKHKREEKRPYNKAINPAGTVFYFNHITRFTDSIYNVVRRKYINYCINGERDNHLGWKFFRVTEEEYNEFHELNPDTPEYPNEDDLIIVPSQWTDTSPSYVKIYDEAIHKPNYNQKELKGEII